MTDQPDTGPPPRPPTPTGAWAALASLRFLAEMAALAALGYAAWTLAAGTSVGLAVVAVAAAPLLAALAWGRWVAPRARHRLADPARLAVEVVVFGTAVLGLVLVDTPGAAVAAAALGTAYVLSSPAGRRGY